MTSTDWLWILHPALMVVVAYPLLGMVLLQARKARQRRLGLDRQPARSGAEHTLLGQWLAASVVAFVLLALAVVITTKVPLAQFAGGVQRLSLLALVWLGTAAALALLLLHCRRAVWRASFALLTWVGVLALGSQKEVWRLSDDPLSPAFWQSHYWGGAALVGLLLLAVAARPEIQRSLRWRRLHLSANVLAALIFVAQGISGSRDLLEIPLSWQKPAIDTCDFSRQVCPTAPLPPG
ncbi:MAG: DUF4079 domain-containing protein [Cyanobacteriota bacterium]